MDSTRYIVCDDAIQYVDDQGTVLAEVTFPACAEGVVDINHTFVDPSLRGQGIAGELMRRTVEALQERNLHAPTLPRGSTAIRSMRASALSAHPRASSEPARHRPSTLPNQHPF